MFANKTRLSAITQWRSPRWHHLWIVGLCSLGLILGLGVPVQAQVGLLSNWSAPVNRTLEIAPVRLDGYRLFHIAVPRPTTNDGLNTNLLAGRQRAHEIRQRLYGIVNTGFDPQTLSIRRDTDGDQTVIRASADTLANEQIVMTVTGLDAQLIASSPRARAAELIPIIRQSLIRAQQERQPVHLVRQAQKTAALGVAIVLAGSVMWRWQRRLKQQSRDLQHQLNYARAANAVDGGSPSPASEMSNGSTTHALRQGRGDRPLRRLRLAFQQPVNLTHQLDIVLFKYSVLQLGLFLLIGVFLWMGLGFFPYTRSFQLFLLSTPLKLVGIGLGSYVSVKFLWVGVDKFLTLLKANRMRDRQASQRLAQRISTLSWVLKSMAASLGIIVGVFASLLLLGVNLLPVVAGLGAFALAISLAAQHVVRDFLNGLLILIEDQYAVGDVIVVGNVGGFVESMSLRLTQLRNDEGRLISIPHGAIIVVENLSKEWSRVDFTIDVAFEVPIEEAFRVIRSVATQLYAEERWQTLILEEPEVLGIDEIDHAGILIRVWLKTKPLEQWTVAREFRYRLKQAFEQEGIWVGVPHQTLGFRNTLELRPQDAPVSSPPLVTRP
ncbi:MAG: mechanosensitive ion channel family protein [Kaiparowitsia implicata GSE-PSE-MK54-09C]|nr:mechanosensitive ion channel family protein [Kaiparowitsia implicata GSE-PSE-MK54-09C]